MGEHDITLNIWEQSIARYIAEERENNKKKHGVTDRKYDARQDSLQLNINGFGAEMAFCKFENVFPDFTIHNFMGGTDAIDKKGRRVDVKWSGTDMLLAPRHKKRNQSDIFVLVKGDFPTFKMIGWATEDELLHEDNLKDWFNKGKEGYGIHKDDLNRMWSNVAKTTYYI